MHRDLEEESTFLPQFQKHKDPYKSLFICSDSMCRAGLTLGQYKLVLAQLPALARVNMLN